MDNLNRSLTEWILKTWDKYPPEFFLTILWNDMPTDPITAQSHTRHTRNLLLREATGVKRCGDIPTFPHRLGITAFQERILNEKGKVTYHTHMHLYNNSRTGSAIITDPKQVIWNSASELQFVLQYKIGPKIKKLLKSTTPGNEGVVVKRWNKTHHQTYNFKEIKRQERKRFAVAARYAQDKDLFLDVLNSDLISPRH